MTKHDKLADAVLHLKWSGVIQIADQALDARQRKAMEILHAALAGAHRRVGSRARRIMRSHDVLEGKRR